ncbi:CD209 antigen-like protein D isoform X2 [Podarcis raffonei]|uniref:CD209 antigen-like protein D isoform X2 n=1 Tax=Podarcis raffonei TaxID=65483 RepID=UPI002329940A|nr:CD209 antigen-like protein D isoform X2 [Podarcis raffonei]XP_053258125.1 CD209 antigen-like protein D isoform X2 [Podarcis raffonei]
MEQPAPTEPPTLSATITDDATERMEKSGIDEAPRKDSAAAKETVASTFRDMVTFLKSPTGERFIILEMFILIAMTLLLFLLYQKEMKKRADFQVGLGMIRNFVVGIDSTYKDKDDFQILAVVQNLSEEVRHLAIQNDQLQKEIDIISKNVNDGWVLFATAYYWFSHGPQSWMNSKKLCEREGAKLISLKTAVEQQFVVNEVKARRKLFWIGLFKDNKAKWRWLPGIEALVTFWKWGEPNRAAKHDCAVMTFNCRGSCWAALNCEQMTQYICKKVPNAAWL